ncbi:hypothetical protein SARC_15568, partial [Sphaeroforma arctica JP610]
PGGEKPPRAMFHLMLVDEGSVTIACSVHSALEMEYSGVETKIELFVLARDDEQVNVHSGAPNTSGTVGPSQVHAHTGTMSSTDTDTDTEDSSRVWLWVCLCLGAVLLCVCGCGVVCVVRRRCARWKSDGLYTDTFELTDVDVWGVLCCRVSARVMQSV